VPQVESGIDHRTETSEQPNHGASHLPRGTLANASQAFEPN
jgi:hypothetical protein